MSEQAAGPEAGTDTIIATAPENTVQPEGAVAVNAAEQVTTALPSVDQAREDLAAVPAAGPESSSPTVPAEAPAPNYTEDPAFKADDEKQARLLAAQDAKYQGIGGFGRRILDRVKNIL